MDSTASPPAHPLAKWRTLLTCLALAVLVAAVYGQTCGLDFEFLNVDDPDYVTSNPHVQQGLSPKSILWAAMAFHAYNWHPLTWLSLQLDYQLYGLSSPGFHFTNVLLHAANTVLLFLVLRRMTNAFWCSAAAAAFFGLHPTHVESVAWVTERKDVLSTLFWLLTMAAYAGYAERPGLGRYLLVMVVFALGLTAKPMLVTLPAVLLLLDYWPLRRWALTARSAPEATSNSVQPSPVFARASLGWLVLEKLPLFALVAASVPLTIAAQQSAIRTLETFPIAVRLQNAAVSCVQYLSMTFWPSGLAIFYPHPRETIPVWQPLAAGLLLLVLTCAVFWAGRRRPYLLVGWLWYLGTLVPVIGIMQVGMHALADRYTYVPSIGLLIMICWGAADLAQRLRLPAWVLPTLAGALLLACLVCTGFQVRYWRNSEVLWRRALAVTENNAVAHDYLGAALLALGRPGEAREHFEARLRLDSWSAATYGNLGLILESQGELQEAVKHYRRSLEIKPDSALAHVSLGRVLETQGKLAEAGEHFEAAQRIQPEAPDPYNHLGRLLKRQGRLTEALEQYDRALERDPNFAEAHSNKGLALEGLGRLSEALTAYQRAVELDADHLLYRCNLAYALQETGQSAAAHRHVSEAFRIEPNWPQIAAQEAWEQATSPDAAQRNGQQALRAAKLACFGTDHQVPECLDILAAAYAELGQFQEAVTWARKALALLSPGPDSDRTRAIQERVHLYEKGQPYRERSPGRPQ
jgi:tetratricopeptide (TPR) repeat protein